MLVQTLNHDEAAARHKEALAQLRRLRLLAEEPVHPEGGAAPAAHFRLHAGFGAQLMDSLCAADDPVQQTDAELIHGPDKNGPSVAQLRAHGVGTWEGLIELVFAPPAQPIALALAGETLQGLLSAAGLIEPRAAAAFDGPAASAGWQISAHGRAFALAPLRAQAPLEQR